jgi:iron complex outermembrane receptor protein
MIAFRGALAVSTALSFVTFQATAQPAPNPATTPTAAQRAASMAPEQVIVTARRREERLQNVPISIKVFSQAALSNRNIQTAEELATNTPSLSANTNFGGQNTTFAIRGFVQDIGTQPSVGTYFAEVVSPRGGSNQLPIGDSLNAGSLFDLQNVQVLKGPQGTLFGLNTTGGAVLLVPQKPTSVLDGYLEAGYGNYDAKSVEGVINIPVSDKIRLRSASTTRIAMATKTTTPASDLPTLATSTTPRSAPAWLWTSQTTSRTIPFSRITNLQRPAACRSW